jgi:hypothetical protein
MTTAEKRVECLRLLVELKKWDIYPFRRDRKKLHKQIKFSYNLTRLDVIHERLESLLDRALMKKLSAGL